jgi:uncharacterized membrane protein
MIVRVAWLGAAVAVLSIACERPPEEAEVSYEFTAIEVPGATATIASGIDDQGRVVGWYVTAGLVKGFLYQDGDFTTIEYPGAVFTQIAGIGADGSMVGAYRNEGEPAIAFHGFLLRLSGEFVEVKHPDHPYTMAQRILANGTIIGCYHAQDATTSMFAIAVRGDDITVRDIPGSMYTGGTPDGRRLAGFLAIEGQGFVAEGQEVTHLEAPGSLRTEVWDMNGAGTLVGVQVDESESTRGFVYQDDHWTTLIAPDSRSTVAFGINGRGQIVGAFEDGEGVRKGYLAARR